MKIEQVINQQLNKMPFVKYKVKRLYQRIMYTIFPKVKFEGNIIKVSPNNTKYEYFFGYYDKSPWDRSDRYMLCIKAKNTWKDVSPKETAKILVIDTIYNTVTEIAETHTWNVQQSCMLQWLGPDFTDQIIFNDYRNGQYCSVIMKLNISEKGIYVIDERIIPAPVYSVSLDGTFALTLDFSRLYRLRPGYGYYNVPEKTKNEKLPDKPCIWKVNLADGSVVPLLKYTDFSNFEPRSEMKGAEHKVNHIMLSPNGKRFAVLHRWFKGERKYTRLVTCNTDGTDLYNLCDDDMVSHCCWKSNNQILAFENKRKYGCGYYLMKDKTKLFERFWKSIDYDGHPSYSPDGSKVIFDRYPDRTRMAAIMVSDAENREDLKVQVLARVFAPFQYDNDTRCDLHPRWNRAGDKICFDSVFEGRRGLYTVEINKKDSEKPVKVLYIVDSLKQRFGVTSVVMNYFRYIDVKKVKIDFMVLENSDPCIVNEIKSLGSEVFFMPQLSLTHFKEFFGYIKKFFKEHNNYTVIHSHFNQLDSLIFPIAKRAGIRNCISHSHNTKYSDYHLRAIRNYIMCIPLKYTATVWAACGIKAGKFLYGNNFIRSPKHLIINNAIDTRKFAFDLKVREEVRNEFGIKNEIVIGNIGSMKLQKNQEFLLKVFSKLQKKSNCYKLILVGDGDLREKLEQTTTELGIKDKVIFTGQRSDVYRLLQGIDIFALPSLYEGLPVIGIEAQAAGLPCLFSDKVTREASICNAQFLSIQNGTAPWISAIQKLQEFNRRNTENKIKSKNFDIKEEANKLAQFYYNLK